MAPSNLTRVVYVGYALETVDAMSALDTVIETHMQGLGFSCVETGMGLLTGGRDLVFEGGPDGQLDTLQMHVALSKAAALDVSVYVALEDYSG